MILPTTSSTEKSCEIDQPVVSNNVSTGETSSENSVAIPGLRIHTRKITMVEEFKCTAEDLFLVLTEKQRLDAFTRSDSQVEAIKGGQFVLFGGNITGTFVEVVSVSLVCLVADAHTYACLYVLFALSLGTR